MKTLDVRVYVPTLNSERVLAKCVKSIRANTGAPVTVIDNYSVDRTVKIANSLGCRVVQLPLNLGQARTWAIEDCSSEFVLFVDSDTYLGADWLARVWTWWKTISESDPRVAAVQGLNYPVHEPFRTYILWAYSQKKYPIKNPSRLDTANILVKTSTAKGFKSDAPVLEDYILGQYLYERGYNVYSVPVYPAHDKPPSMIKQDFIWGGAGYRKYGDRGFHSYLLAPISMPLKSPSGLRTAVFKIHLWTLIGYLSKDLNRRHKET